MGKKDQFKKDSEYEGKGEYFMDVDRMINEGMAGGTFSMRDGHGQEQIEEARELKREDPPHKVE